MANDPNRKSLRHFHCRDQVWEVFEQMSIQFECSMDYLINEAMRQYARTRGNTTLGGQAPITGSLPPGPRDSVPPPLMVPRLPALPMASRPPTLPGARPGPPKIPAVGRPPALTPAAPIPLTARVPSLPTTSAAPSTNPPPGGSASDRRSTLPPVFAPANIAPTKGVLEASYAGQTFKVDKDEFVIGRGLKTSDLVINDSNVSRRHAVVLRHNGHYWIVDQQSTNGIEFMGAKIERKRIENGDKYRICDHEIHFEYR